MSSPTQHITSTSEAGDVETVSKKGGANPTHCPASESSTDPEESQGQCTRLPAPPPSFGFELKKPRQDLSSPAEPDIVNDTPLLFHAPRSSMPVSMQTSGEGKHTGQAAATATAAASTTANDLQAAGTEVCPGELKEGQSRLDAIETDWLPGVQSQQHRGESQGRNFSRTEGATASSTTRTGQEEWPEKVGSTRSRLQLHDNDHHNDAGEAPGADNGQGKGGDAEGEDVEEEEGNNGRQQRQQHQQHQRHRQEQRPNGSPAGMPGGEADNPMMMVGASGEAFSFPPAAEQPGIKLRDEPFRRVQHMMGHQPHGPVAAQSVAMGTSTSSGMAPLAMVHGLLPAVAGQAQRRAEGSGANGTPGGAGQGQLQQFLTGNPNPSAPTTAVGSSATAAQASSMMQLMLQQQLQFPYLTNGGAFSQRAGFQQLQQLQLLQHLNQQQQAQAQAQGTGHGNPQHHQQQGRQANGYNEAPGSHQNGQHQYQYQQQQQRQSLQPQQTLHQQQQAPFGQLGAQPLTQSLQGIQRLPLEAMAAQQPPLIQTQAIPQKGESQLNGLPAFSSAQPAVATVNEGGMAAPPSAHLQHLQAMLGASVGIGSLSGSTAEAAGGTAQHRHPVLAQSPSLGKTHGSSSTQHQQQNTNRAREQQGQGYMQHRAEQTYQQHQKQRTYPQLPGLQQLQQPQSQLQQQEQLQQQRQQQEQLQQQRQQQQQQQGQQRQQEPQHQRQGQEQQSEPAQKPQRGVHGTGHFESWVRSPPSWNLEPFGLQTQQDGSHLKDAASHTSTLEKESLGDSMPPSATPVHTCALSCPTTSRATARKAQGSAGAKRSKVSQSTEDPPVIRFNVADRGDEQARRQRRLEKNRQAAKASRLKKKTYMQDLEKRVKQLERNNDSLLREVEVFRETNERLRRDSKHLRVQLAKFTGTMLPHTS